MKSPLLPTGGHGGAPGYTSLGSADSGSLLNPSGVGSLTFAVTVNVNPGQAVWLGCLLQTPAANGATVNATMTSAVPEPGTLALAGLSLVAQGFACRSRR